MTSVTAGEHATTVELEAALGWIRQAPADDGRLLLIVARPAEGERLVLESGVLDPEVGLVGDTWSRRPTTSTADRSPSPERQLTVMNHRLARVVARGEERVHLAGDQLYVDLDLSVENTPPGTRLAIGEAVIELTAPPHLGCAKFVARFGREAMSFVNSPTGRALRLRGANARVVTSGRVSLGDGVRKLAPLN